MSAIAKRLDKLEQARKPNDGTMPPVLMFTSASETGAAYVTIAGFGDKAAEQVFDPLPGESHAQTLRRACLMAKRGECLPFVAEHQA